MSCSVEALEVKEIFTPAFCAAMTKALDTISPGDGQVDAIFPEDTSDSVYITLHQIMELAEKRRFAGLDQTRKHRRRTVSGTNLLDDDDDAVEEHELCPSHHKTPYGDGHRKRSNSSGSPNCYDGFERERVPSPLTVKTALPATSSPLISPALLSSPSPLMSPQLTSKGTLSCNPVLSDDLFYPPRVFPLDAKMMAAIELAEKRRAEAEVLAHCELQVVSSSVTNIDQGHAPLKLVLRVAP